jgi:hypothetical protein
MIGRPAGSRLRSGRLPGARVRDAWSAARPMSPALSLLGSGSPPRAGIPRVGAESGAGLPAAGRASARSVRGLPCGPVWPLRRIGRLPGSGAPHVLAERSLAGLPARSLLRSCGLPRSCVPRVLVELPGHLRAAGLPGSVGVGIAVRAGDIRRLAGRLAVGPGRWRLAPAERTRNELALADRPWPLPLTELAGSRLSGSELALPVAGRPLPRFSLPVSGLAGRPRLFMTVGTLLCPGPLPGTRPARIVLAGPGLLPRGVRAGTGLGLARRHCTGLTWYTAGRPLLSGVSRWLRVLSRSRRPPGRGPVLRSRPSLRLPWVGLTLPLEVLFLVPVPLVPGHLRPRGAVGRTLAGPGCVRVRPRPLRVVGPRGAGPARWRRARLARPRLARGSLPWPVTGWSWPWTANTWHRVLGTLPG